MRDQLSRLNMGSGVAQSVLRVVVGVLLAWHGYRKFADGLEGFEGFLDFLELPAPGLLAVLVALLELVGGIMLALGLLTRVVSLLFVVEFAIIVLWVKLNKLDAVLLAGTDQPALEVDLLNLSSALFFVFAGPGAIAVDKMFGLEAEAERSERIPAAV